MSVDIRPLDIIIVGGGLAGLAAAGYLRAQHNVTVSPARLPSHRIASTRISANDQCAGTRAVAARLCDEHTRRLRHVHRRERVQAARRTGRER